MNNINLQTILKNYLLNLNKKVLLISKDELILIPFSYIGRKDC